MKKWSKTVLRILLFMVFVWVAVGVYARRDVFFLMDHVQWSKGRNDENAISFGISFYAGSHESIHWLDDNEYEVLWNLIANGSRDTLGKYNFIFRMYGRLYVYPKWVRRFGLEKLLIPLQPRIDLIYVPSRQYLYLSEDCERLHWDCVEGLGVHGVRPELLDVDIVALLRRLEGSDVPRERYADLLDMIPTPTATLNVPR